MQEKNKKKNYCKNCIYLRTRERNQFIYEGKEVPPYIPGGRREYYGDFVCGLISDEYFGDRIKKEKKKKVFDVIHLSCREPVSINFYIEKQDKFGCNFFEEKK